VIGTLLVRLHLFSKLSSRQVISILEFIYSIFQFMYSLREA